MENGLVQILHGDKLQAVPVKDGARLELSRNYSPGKFTFTIPTTKNIELEEGDQVRFSWDGENVFFGFLFSRSFDADGECDCVAYDQLRYLKNRDTVVFKDCDSKQLFELIANTFGVSLGEITQCSLKFNRVEENKSGLDMIADYCDEILLNKDKMFVVYDDFGKIVFKDVESQMGLGYLLTAENSNEYSYKISIDEETYNKIKIVSSDTKEYVSAKDNENIFKWGLLQSYKVIQEIPTEEKAKEMLDRYNRPSKNFTIKDAFGDIRIKGGTWIPVNIQTETELINCPLIVDKVTHNFNSDQYTMDLTLIGGGGFVA